MLTAEDKIKADAIIRVKPEYEVKHNEKPGIKRKKPANKVKKPLRRRESESSDEEPINPGIVVPVVPVIVQDVAPKVNFAELSEPEKESEFWKDIINIKTRGTAYVAKMDEERREYFKNTYFKYYDAMNERLRFDEMFARNGIDSLVTQASIISYSIGEGRETYNNLYADLDMYQNLIVIEEYTNFENKLPVDMQH